MKKIITLFILFVATQIFAQNNGISYQAIILNPKGEQLPGVNNSTSPLANKNICMVFKFVDEFSNIEYQETIQTKTDGFGMVNLVIGSGNQTAGYATSFKDIVWNISKKSLSVGINTDGSCSNFTEISNQEFSYVPLAFSAINAENVTGVVAIENGGTNATTLLGAKTNLEINNVDNTSDLNKPISTATQTALSLKEVLSNKSTDLATDGDSDTKYPSVKSVKMYVDGKLLTSSNALIAEITRATAAENTIAADLATETTNRTSADATLTSNLAAEVTRATAAENTIAADLATETTNRTSADATLTTNLTAEVTRATNAENTIVADLVTETTNRTSADATLTTNLAAEVTRATAAENTIAADLVTETTNRIATDATLTTNLATEVSRATAAENTIAADLATEITNRTSSDAILTTNLATEVTNRTNADLLKEDLANKSTDVTADGTSDTKYPTVKSVKTYVDANATIASTALTNEINRATAAEGTLTTNLAIEVDRAIDAEDVIAANLLTETTNRTNADATLTANLAIEVDRATDAEDAIAANLLTETTNRTNADDTLTASLATEVDRATDAEDVISANLLTETTNRTNADDTLTASLATEVDRATDAEDAIAANLLTETTNRTNADDTLTASLATEVDRATDVEDAIAANLLTETTNRTSADATLQTNINSVQADVDANELATNNALALKAPLASPTFTGTVSGIDKMMVGLGNVDDTSDLDKPISTATQTVLDLKADLFSPTFTGVPLAPTADSGTTSTQIATTKFVSDAISTLSVPYTGATGPVDLGIYDLKINGTSFGTNGQPGNIGIGINAGSNTQGSNAVAIGNETAMNTQGSNAVAIGAYTAGITQGSNAVAVGNQVAYTNQGASAIAIGNETASINQGENAIAIGSSTGYNNQGSYALAVGGSAGNNNQGSYAIAVGVNSGNNTQGSNAIAIGNETGNENQGSHAVAVGNMAGKINQGSTAISIGSNAGRDNQGENSIAIGSNAGKNNQNSNSIILNATGADLDTTTSGFFVDPIRNVSSSTALFYNTATKEITYESLPSVSLTSGVNDILPVSNGGSGVNTSTGTGSLVLSASPTFTGTVSGIDKTMIGLSNADDTSDLNKPISTATQTALDLKAPIESPTFTGTPSLPTGTIGVTQTAGNNTTALATTAFVTSANATNANLTGMVTSVGNATTVVTNANLTGPITSSGNATSVASQTGTGSKFVMDTAPTLVTPVLGVATATSVNGTSIPTSKTLVVTTDKLSALSATTSAELAGVISDETGTGSVVLSASPTFTGTVSGIDKTMIGLSNADDTSDLNKPISTATQTALDLKANLASPIFTGTVSGIDKTMVGLGNVDNISDANKPVSAATQTALNLKANLASPTFTGTVSGIDKTMVGLGNVDNTSDANKPISTATQTALDLKAPLASPTFTGTVSGITKAMVNLGNADNTSDANKPVSAATQTALDLKAPLESPTFTGTVSGITKAMVNLGNADNTSDANKPISTATQTVLNLKVDKVSGKGLSTEDYTTTEKTKLAAVTGTNTGDQDISGIAINTTKIGDLASLTTTNTSNIVAAVNEIQATKAPLTSPTFAGTVTASGTLTANAIVKSGGTSAQFLKADGSVDSNVYFIPNTSKIAIGYIAGSGGQGDHSIAIGGNTAQGVQAENAIGIGYAAGQYSQGLNSIAIGAFAGNNTQPANSIVLNATGVPLNGSASGLFVDPIRSASGSSSLFYNTTTKEITYGNSPSVSLISGVTGTLPIANGGTGSSTQNFIDLTTNQTIAGTKTFSSNMNINGVTIGKNGSQSMIIGESTYSGTDGNVTAVGFMSLNGNSGANNTALGSNALRNSGATSYNTAIGLEAGSSVNTGGYNTLLGYSAKTNSATPTITNAVAIGNGATVNASNTIQLGNTSITNVNTSGTLTSGAVTYPKTHGTSGQVLSTTGSGTLSWTTPTGGSGTTNYLPRFTSASAIGDSKISDDGTRISIGNPNGGQGSYSGFNSDNNTRLFVNGGRELESIKMSFPGDPYNNVLSFNWYNTAWKLRTERNSANITDLSFARFDGTSDIEYMKLSQLGNLSVVGTVTANSLVKLGGTSSQYLMADGSVSTGAAAVREVADEFTATAAQTSFTLTQTPSVNSKVKMYVNGIRISNTAYSVSGNTLTYNPANNGAYALSAGDRVQMDYYW